MAIMAYKQCNQLNFNQKRFYFQKNVIDWESENLQKTLEVMKRSCWEGWGEELRE